MLNSIDALFDGKVFHPQQPFTLGEAKLARITAEKPLAMIYLIMETGSYNL